MNTYAVMGLNTEILQAALVASAKVHSVMPAKIAAKLNIKEGDFKLEALPVDVPENITALK